MAVDAEAGRRTALLLLATLLLMGLGLATTIEPPSMSLQEMVRFVGAWVPLVVQPSLP